MKHEKVCLIINPRAGQNLARLTDILAVLAADWKTDIALKVYYLREVNVALSSVREEVDDSRFMDTALRRPINVPEASAETSGSTNYTRVKRERLASLRAWTLPRQAVSLQPRD
jgi:hypothetical protein